MIICVKGVPIPKARPRVTRSGHAYTPQRTKDYEAKIKQAYLEQAAGEKLSGPISLKMTFHMPIPKSWPKKKRQRMSGEWHTSRPDADNLLKAVQDALNGLAYDDDAEICHVEADKVYADIDYGLPEAVISIKQVRPRKLED